MDVENERHTSSEVWILKIKKLMFGKVYKLHKVMHMVKYTNAICKMHNMYVTQHIPIKHWGLNAS